ncbi:uncharacterized protein LOC118190441 [Stegodyphus dumicola]|uniref:uncharacterized protein LOC118190441 n=1 Tax=Stegodyphus dumicola TaxID=202533 RepID=UPI0015AA819F|nr:uncharacterized protein LOC118190441 [Stegodyphus dumicola]
MESFNQVNGYHPDSHSIQYQIREQSNAKEDVGGNQGNCSTENENNVIGTMQEIQICSINKKSNVDQNCISRNVQVAHRFNWNSCISRNIEMTDWFSQKSESSNLLLYTWPKPHPPSAINKPSNCSSDCTKLRQKLLDIRNKEYALSDKYLNLEILYGKKCEELVQQKQEEFKQRGLAEAKIQALMSAKEFLEVERRKLSSRLQVADRLVTNIRRENNILRERLKTIAPQKSRNEENQFTQVQQFQSNQTDLKAHSKQMN